MLLHLSLPGLQGIRGVAALREQCPEIRLMVFSDVPNETEGLALLRLGIHGYANTHMADALLQRAVEVVGQRRPVVAANGRSASMVTVPVTV